MASQIVRNWFGGQFDNLHPLLQKLHTGGGTLRGAVSIVYGDGLAGLIGRRLAKTLHVPEAGAHDFFPSIFLTIRMGCIGTGALINQPK